MNVDVVNISIEGHLRAISPVAQICCNETDVISRYYPLANLSRFPISTGLNKITTLGCDSRGEIKKESFLQTGCPTMPGICDMPVGLCSQTVGCCQSTIEPAQLTSFKFRVESNTGSVGKKGFNKCSYAVIVEDGRYNFSSIDVNNLTMEDLDSYEMRLDWTVGDTTCQKARKNISSYLCKDNSKCVDVNNGRGYRCSCSDGYQGNPYLGCLDVNECKDGSLNNCTHECRNTDGSYTCHCPKGHIGDGQKDGTSCMRFGIYAQNRIGLYIGISVGAIITSLTMISSYNLLKQRRIAKQKETIFKRNGGTIFQKLLSECEGPTRPMIKIFTEKELKKATNNFNMINIVGQGGFGTVYKGVLIDNTKVAIKKSKVTDPSQIEQFINELVLLAQINHPNIVRLVGCCLETHVPLLVYEYIVNKTLHHHLHGKSHGSSLTWSMRLRLAVETAGALAYMHSTTKIIHRDIKSSNVLLTDDYAVKVSDFGISRAVPKDKMYVSTVIQGTFGLDPEYFKTNMLTDKSDVYSFGFVLVELLTGEKVNNPMVIERSQSLIDYFDFLLNGNRLIEIIDNQVKLGSTSEQLNRVARLAKSCIRPLGNERPTMQEVKEELLAVQMSLICHV